MSISYIFDTFWISPKSRRQDWDTLFAGAPVHRKKNKNRSWSCISLPVCYTTQNTYPCLLVTILNRAFWHGGYYWDFCPGAVKGDCCVQETWRSDRAEAHPGLILEGNITRETSTGGSHDDVIKWKHFPRYWPCVQGIHRSPVNSPHKGQWRELWCFLWSEPEQQHENLGISLNSLDIPEWDLCWRKNNIYF